MERLTFDEASWWHNTWMLSHGKDFERVCNGEATMVEPALAVTLHASLIISLAVSDDGVIAALPALQGAYIDFVSLLMIREGVVTKQEYPKVPESLARDIESALRGV